MVTMSNVWDRAMDVVRGRAGILASIAAVGLFLPGLVRDGVSAFVPPNSVAFAVAVGLVTIVVAVIGLWAQLGLLAVATDPATDRAGALRQATARLPASIAVAIVLGLLLILAMLPLVIAVAVSGVDLSAMGTPGGVSGLGRGTVLFLAFYLLALLPIGVFVLARLSLINAVVLNERRGLGAFRRSFELTRGLTWRLIGVALLYLIVVGVAVLAAQFITGTLFGLLLGRGSPGALFLTAAVTGAVAATFSVIATAFVAQLYVAVTQRGVATVFE